MSIPDVFHRITTKLDHAGIAYMLTGAFASAHYGSPRSTQDIDFVIAATPEQLRSLVNALESAEYYAELQEALEAQRRQSLFNIIDLRSGWKIDLIFRKSRPFSQEEFSRRQPARVEGVDIYLASAEDVIITKLEWPKLGNSQRQIEDAAAILRLKRDALDQTYLEKWISELGLQQQWRTANQRV